ncbi:MAG: SpoIIE family protein phosphatase [Bacteroidales bacterium]|nr:SpoIIE family protein phosphatase [Bacteroidales bacterium]
MKRIHSFSTRLSLGIVGISSIIFILAIGTAMVLSYTIVAEEAVKSAENLRDASIAKIEKTLLEVEMNVQARAWLVKENLDDEQYLYHITHQIVEENPNIIGSAIAFDKKVFKGKYYFSPYSYQDGEGGILSKQLGSAQYDYFYMDWFQIPFLMGKDCWSEPYFDEGGAQELLSTYSYPIYGENGEVIAVMTADISLDWIEKLLADIKPYPNSNIILVSRSGAFISNSSGIDLSGETVFSTMYYASGADNNVLLLAEALSRGETGAMEYSVGNKVSFAVYAPLSNGWKTYISCDYKDVLSRAARMNIFMILIGLLGVITMFLLSYYMIRRLTKPLSEFSDSVIRIAKGDFDAQLPEIRSEDELKQLRNSFEYMQKSLKDYIRELQVTTSEKQKFISEINIASKIQMSMLPTDFLNTDRVGLYAMVLPAKEVGGDLYDFFIKDNILYFAVGDVSGKGIPASLIMAITRASFRFITRMGLPMNEVMSKMNDALAEGNTTGLFVTLFVGRLDLETGELQYCNGGHNPIVTVTPEGEASFMKPKPNIAAGLFEGFPYVLETCTLRKGSKLVLYTDGVTEAERADKDQFGEQRLLDWATSAVKVCPEAEEACKNLYDTVKQYTDGNEQNDDITIMTIRYN